MLSSFMRRLFKKKTKAKRATDAAGDPDVTERTQQEDTPRLTADERLVEEFMEVLNSNPTVEEQLRFHESPNIRIKFDDEPSMTILEMSNIITNTVYKSFPDFQFSYESLRQFSPGVVVLENCQPNGTHTGTPFQLPNLPPIPAAGKFVKLDPERLFFTIRSGKIAEIEVVALGRTTGPLGLYEGLGGQLPAR